MSGLETLEGLEPNLQDVYSFGLRWKAKKNTILYLHTQGGGAMGANPSNFRESYKIYKIKSTCRPDNENGFRIIINPYLGGIEGHIPS